MSRPDNPAKPDLYIHVVGWDKFQHGSTRDNPWIKDYRDQLHKDEWRDLSFHLRGVLQSIRLAYAASHRQLRGSTATLTRHLGMRVTTRDLERLSDAGFIELRASTALAQNRVEEKDIEANASMSPDPPKRASSKPRKPRAPDPIWDTLVAVIGGSPAGLERGRWNAAVKSLKESGATPETLQQAADAYRTLPSFHDCVMTPTALAANWTILVTSSNGSSDGILRESAEQFRARIAATDKANRERWTVP